MPAMRLQRFLARAGVASRRGAEALIEAGKVRVDGRTATIGMSVDPETARVTVGRRPVRLVPRRWVAVHKPLGVITTAADESGRRTVFDLLDDPTGLAYVGRLDVATTGLLLLSTDGEAIHRLTHPRYRIPRSYIGLVHGVPTDELAARARGPVKLDGRPVVPLRVRVRGGHAGRSILEVTLAEGRNRVVRRWVEAMGGKVERLARITYGPVRLGDLPPGRWRDLTPAEVRAIYRAIDMSTEEG